MCAPAAKVGKKNPVETIAVGDKTTMRRRSSDRGIMTLERVLLICLTIIGGLTTVIWGIVWNGLTNVNARTGSLEGDNKVIEVRLKAIDQGQTEIKLELKEVKSLLSKPR